MPSGHSEVGGTSWEPSEVAALRRAVEKAKLAGKSVDWERVSRKALGGKRTISACKQRWHHHEAANFKATTQDKKSKTKRKRSSSESESDSTTPAQLKRPAVKKQANPPWSVEEDALLLKKTGNKRLSELSQHDFDRFANDPKFAAYKTGNSLRARFRSLLDKKKAADSSDDSGPVRSRGGSTTSYSSARSESFQYLSSSNGGSVAGPSRRSTPSSSSSSPAPPVIRRAVKTPSPTPPPLDLEGTKQAVIHSFNNLFTSVTQQQARENQALVTSLKSDLLPESATAVPEDATERLANYAKKSKEGFQELSNKYEGIRKEIAAQWRDRMDGWANEVVATGI